MIDVFYFYSKNYSRFKSTYKRLYGQMLCIKMDNMIAAQK